MLVRTPYGWLDVRRKKGDVLQPSLVSRETLETYKRASAYNFAAQFQQDPEPETGFVVQRPWLKFYTPEEKPKRFEMVIQSWDTANKDTELANFSVCTTWGLTSRNLYLLDVFREKLEFPDLKRSVKRLAREHKALVVLVEDKASGTPLIQELRAEQFSIVQPAPSLPGDKTMRLRSQTAKIEGGFVLFPNDASWLAVYLRELLSFPIGKYDDQVDSTVFALAWITENPHHAGTFFKRPSIHYYDRLPEDQRHKRVFMAWDTALKDGGQGDWTVCTVWMLLDGVYYLRHMERGIYEYSDLKQKFVELNQQYKPFKILIEETTTGKALKKDLKLPGNYLIKLAPIEPDRKGRAYVLQSMFKQGLVRFPKNAPFTQDVESELLSYPDGQTHDIVDSIAIALTVGGSGYDSTLSWV